MRLVEAYTYAIFSDSDEIKHIGLYADQATCWEIYLGWPTPDEIEWSKKQGFKCKRVVITPMTDRHPT